jgi:hypothetical protein
MIHQEPTAPPKTWGQLSDELNDDEAVGSADVDEGESNGDYDGGGDDAEVDGENIAEDEDVQDMDEEHDEMNADNTVAEDQDAHFEDEHHRKGGVSPALVSSVVKIGESDKGELLGTCMSMCSDSSWNRGTDPFHLLELDSDNKPSRELAVTKYERNDAGKTKHFAAESLRPPGVLLQTVNHLIDYALVHRWEKAVCGGRWDSGSPSTLVSKNQRSDIFGFVHDRCRRIITEINMQRSSCMGLKTAHLLQQMLRIIVWGNYFLKGQPSMVPDKHMRELYTNCQEKLFEVLR